MGCDAFHSGQQGALARRGALFLLAGFAAVLWGCSPALNWREVRVDGAPLQALMPCKPERATREVPLLGLQAPSLPLHMLSCEASGATYALAAALLPNGAPSIAEQAQQAWRLAAWASLKQPLTPGATAPAGWAELPFAAPAPVGLQRLSGWQGPGLAHNGQPLQARILWAQQGPWLVQVAVYAPSGASGVNEAWAIFTDGLRPQP
ncbi:MAG: hypothetical protein RL323_1098 [Pseudomonadota bacterium]